jgi:hypothetical protein
MSTPTSNTIQNHKKLSYIKTILKIIASENQGVGFESSNTSVNAN